MSEENIEGIKDDEVSAAHGYHKDIMVYKEPEYREEETEVSEKKIEETTALPSPNIRLSNTNPLTQEQTTYSLEKFKKKIIYIFNNNKVAGCEERKGTEQDELKIKEVFGDLLGFEIEKCPDLTFDQLFGNLGVLNQMKHKDFSDYGCIGIVILTHGNKNGILMAADKSYMEGDILQYFKSNINPSLVTKPKFLCIQSCRGREASQSTQVGLSEISKLRKDHADEVVNYTLPVESDILVLHSSYNGKCSLRHVEDGSLFIQSLCAKIKQHHEDRHLEDIMKLVMSEIAINEYGIENKQTNELQMVKQMSVMTTTLTRYLYLRKYKKHESESKQSLLKDGSFPKNESNAEKSDELESQQDYPQNNTTDDKEQSETENHVQKDEIDDPVLPCQCDRVKTNYVDCKYAYLKHNTQLYINKNNDSYAVKLFDTVQTLEKDPHVRYKKDNLSSMLEPLTKNRVIFCSKCNTFKFNECSNTQ